MKTVKIGPDEIELSDEAYDILQLRLSGIPVKCPECEKRKKAKTDSQRKWRNKQKVRQ